MPGVVGAAHSPIATAMNSMGISSQLKPWGAQPLAAAAHSPQALGVVAHSVAEQAPSVRQQKPLGQVLSEAGNKALGGGIPGMVSARVSNASGQHVDTPACVANGHVLVWLVGCYTRSADASAGVALLA